IRVDPLVARRAPSSQTASVEVDAVEQHRELRRFHIDVPRAFADRGELEAPAFEPLQIEHEAVAVPEEDFYLVLRFADEDEEVPLEGVLLQRAFDQRPQPVDAL